MGLEIKHPQPLPPYFRGIPASTRCVSQTGDTKIASRWYQTNSQDSARTAIVRSSPRGLESFEVRCQRLSPGEHVYSFSVQSPGAASDTCHQIRGVGAPELLRLGMFAVNLLDFFETCGAQATLTELGRWLPQPSPAPVASLETLAPPRLLGEPRVVEHGEGYAARKWIRGERLVLTCERITRGPSMTIEISAVRGPGLDTPFQELANLLTGRALQNLLVRHELADPRVDLRITVGQRDMSSPLGEDLRGRIIAIPARRTLIIGAHGLEAALDLFWQRLPFFVTPQAPTHSLLRDAIISLDDRASKVKLWAIATTSEVVRLEWDITIPAERERLLKQLSFFGSREMPLELRSCFALPKPQSIDVPGESLRFGAAALFCKELEHLSRTVFGELLTDGGILVHQILTENGHDILWRLPGQRSLSIECNDEGPQWVTLRQNHSRTCDRYRIGGIDLTQDAWLRIFEAGKIPGFLGRFTPYVFLPIARTLRHEVLTKAQRRAGR